MNNIKGFTFYKEYFELITLLPIQEQGNLLLKIMEFVFEDKEVDELTDSQRKIWNNLIRPITKSKTKSYQGSSKNKNETANENKNETTNEIDIESTNTSKMSMSMSIVNDNVINKKVNRGMGEEEKEKYFENEELNNKYLEYLKMRKEKKCKATDTTIKNQVAKLSKKPIEEALSILQYSINNGYQGLFEQKQTGQATKEANIPEWFGKEIEKEKLGEEEEEELNRILEEFK